MDANDVKKTVVCLVVGAGLVAAVGSAAVMASSGAQAADAGHTSAVVASAAEAGRTRAMPGFVAVSQVEGRFSVSQTEVTPNDQIRSAFRTVTAALCGSAPADEVPAAGDWTVEVGGSGVPRQFTATMQQLAEEASETYLMGCACSVNLAGGKGIVNAEVEGMSIASIAALAGVAY